MKIQRIISVLCGLVVLGACGGGSSGEIGGTCTDGSDKAVCASPVTDTDEKPSTGATANADITAAQDVDSAINGFHNANDEYTAYKIQCSYLRVVWLMLESTDDSFVPTLSVWADPYTEEEYGTAFPNGYTANVALICPDDGIHEVHIEDFDRDKGGPFILYVETGDACGDLVPLNEYPCNQ